MVLFTLSEWPKTAPLKKCSMPNQLARKGRPNLKWIEGLEKDLLDLRTMNWRTPAGRRLAWKRLLEKAKGDSPLAFEGISSLGCRATEKGRSNHP
ncbi:hypothetical protein TNCV_1391401 [Trichonephila clavipes]|nr:hypothetical protein TNCV_1391401 [Trichonephila clavipes]